MNRINIEYNDLKRRFPNAIMVVDADGTAHWIVDKYHVTFPENYPLQSPQIEPQVIVGCQFPNGDRVENVLREWFPGIRTSQIVRLAIENPNGDIFVHIEELNRANRGH